MLAMSNTSPICERSPWVDINLTRLLIVYWIIPLAVGVCVLDQNVLNFSLLQLLPFRPESFVIWTFVFGMPHVFAGVNIFADNEYLQKYGWKLAQIMCFFLVLPIVIENTLGHSAILILFAFMIMYHTVSQQFGLTLAALGKKPSLQFHIWKWTTVSFSTTYFVMMYWEPLPIVLYDNGFLESLTLFSKIIFSVSCLSGLLVLCDNRYNRAGRLHVVANMSLVVAEYYLFTIGYFFFIVLIARVIHEFTAWPIYIAHDKNRNHLIRNNVLYKLFPVAWHQNLITVALAFSFGILLTVLCSWVNLLSSVIVSFSLYHYYSEHFLWRRDSLLRRCVRFV